MPYKFETEKVPLPRSQDKRVKLTHEQREEIRKRKGENTYKLAEQYKVSRRLVTFIQNPEKQRENLLRRQERGGSMVYYNKDKHRESMQRYRKSKKERLDNEPNN